MGRKPLQAGTVGHVCATMGQARSGTGRRSRGDPGAKQEEPAGGHREMKKIAFLCAVLLAPMAAQAQSMPGRKSYAQTGDPAHIVPSAGTTDGVAASLVQYTPAWTGAVGRPMSARLTDSLNVKDFGAACNGTVTSDDTNAFNAAMKAAAASNKHVSIPGVTCYITSTVTIPAGVTVSGAGMGSTIIQAGSAGKFVFGAGAYAGIQDLTITQYGTNPSCRIDAATNTPFGASIRDVHIINPVCGIDLSGNSQMVDRARIEGVTRIGLRIGHTTTLAATVDPRVTNTTIASARGATGMRIEDAGGLYLVNNDVLYGAYGTVFDPGKNQQITWVFASNTVLSDTATVDGLKIDTADATAQVKGLNFEGSWSSSNGNMGVNIKNTAGGSIQNIAFSGMRFYGNRANTIDVTGMSHFRIFNSEFCGGGPAGTDLYINTGVTHVIVANNDFTGTCGNEASGSPAGIVFVSRNNNVVVQGNDFAGLTTAINLGSNRTIPSSSITGNLK
ncbi:hypothetical protein C3920_05005 [Novacetimonas pomaceti]|uniref:Rhamnogalacturonase A/B/Epimerase-like pectate lyase domain-containing protein n=2 Tax=Novacetimonas pomaceti TaxID=2021998 RepID=A0ABX5P908_9PROT|nr:hypothetical protein C3920_05005 [Novacetimonas pomaceti]